VKQAVGIVSIDEGMQIDRRDEPINADSPRLGSLQSSPNRTNETELQSRKHPAERDSISPPINSSSAFPRYRISEMALKSMTKSPETLKNRFAASTTTLRIPEPASAKPVIFRRLAGIRIDRSDEQSRNANSPTVKMCESDSKVTFDSPVHCQKQEEEIVSTDEGIEIERRDRQSSNADLPKAETRHPGSKLNFERERQVLKQQSGIM
jgi:hypothetical protein